MYSSTAFKSLAILLGIILISQGNIYAGSITSPGGAPSTTSYTLTDIFNRIKTNATATLGNHSLSPTTTPQSSFHSLIDIYNAIPTIDPGKVIIGTTYLGVAGTAVEGTPITPADKLPLKTGQTLCYDTNGATISCAGTGQDGELQKGTARSYTDNADGTISDNATGLMWQKCTYGLSGNDCETGTATAVIGHNSTTTCETATTAGYTDWKLPNINELVTLRDYSSTSVLVNITYFPNTPTAKSFWTSSQMVYSRPLVYGVWFEGVGYDMGSPFNPVSNSYIRCVRVEASPASSAPAQPLATEQTTCFESGQAQAGLELDCTGIGQDGEYQAGISHSFTNNEDGTITDNVTGLMWQRCTYGMTTEYCDVINYDVVPWGSTFSQAVSVCSAATTGGYTDWRLPNINELKSLILYNRVVALNHTERLTMDPKYFPINYGTIISSTIDAYSASQGDLYPLAMEVYEGVVDVASLNYDHILCVR